MSRQEDFQKQAEKYANVCGGTTQEKCAIMTDHFTGSEYGYQYAIDKACEWLTNNLHLVRDWSGTPSQNYKELVRMLRKEMEEQLWNKKM